MPRDKNMMKMRCSFCATQFCSTDTCKCRCHKSTWV